MLAALRVRHRWRCSPTSRSPRSARGTTPASISRDFAGPYVVGGDAAFPRKPDPAGLLHLIAQAAVTPAEAALVGDSDSAIGGPARNVDDRSYLAQFSLGSASFRSTNCRVGSGIDSPGLFLQRHCRLRYDPPAANCRGPLQTRAFLSTVRGRFGISTARAPRELTRPAVCSSQVSWQPSRKMVGLPALHSGREPPPCRNSDHKGGAAACRHGRASRDVSDLARRLEHNPRWWRRSVNPRTLSFALARAVGLTRADVRPINVARAGRRRLSRRTKCTRIPPIAAGLPGRTGASRQLGGAAVRARHHTRHHPSWIWRSRWMDEQGERHATPQKPTSAGRGSSRRTDRAARMAQASRKARRRPAVTRSSPSRACPRISASKEFEESSTASRRHPPSKRGSNGPERFILDS